MPVILTPEQEELWLDAATPAPLLVQLMSGLPAGALNLRPVTSAVNNVRNDGPECLGDAAGDAGADQSALF
jgi:putative SOS response-associated peptidase YedK